MSCPSCEAAQEPMAEIGGMFPVAYVRVGTGNVAIVGCQEHVARLIHAYRALVDAAKPGG